MKKLIVIPLMLILFVVYYISSMAEINRTPFDIPEAESELVQGYMTEYSGMKFAIFIWRNTRIFSPYPQLRRYSFSEAGRVRSTLS